MKGKMPKAGPKLLAAVRAYIAELRKPVDLEKRWALLRELRRLTK